MRNALIIREGTKKQYLQIKNISFDFLSLNEEKIVKIRAGKLSVKFI
jgi:hypothetical protein